MKDFYDVSICSKHLDFDGNTLTKALDATFKNRDTPVPTEQFEQVVAKLTQDDMIALAAYMASRNPYNELR